MNTTNVRAVPEGMHTVTPFLVCTNAAEALEFYKRAFGATEVTRLTGPQEKIMYSQLRLGDSAVCVVDEFPDWGSFSPTSLKGSPVTLHLYVEDVDAVFSRAVEAGAQVKMPVDDMFWGDRYGTLEDPFGHRWSVATHTRDVSPEEMQQAIHDMGSAST